MGSIIRKFSLLGLAITTCIIVFGCEGGGTSSALESTNYYSKLFIIEEDKYFSNSLDDALSGLNLLLGLIDEWENSVDDRYSGNVAYVRMVTYLRLYRVYLKLRNVTKSERFLDLAYIEYNRPEQNLLSLNVETAGIVKEELAKFIQQLDYQLGPPGWDDGVSVNENKIPHP